MEEDNKTVDQPKKNKGLIIVIYVVLFLIGCALGYFVSTMVLNDDKSNTKNNTEEKGNNSQVEENKEKEEKEEKENDNKELSNISDLDLEKMRTSLHNLVQKEGFKANKLSCTVLPAAEGELPNVKSKRTVVSENTIDIIINKLKTAKSIDKYVTASWIGECYPKSVAYIISLDAEVDTNEFQNNKKFTLYYSDSENILLVGYEGIGYDFNFNDGELNNFIEALK